MVGSTFDSTTEPPAHLRQISENVENRVQELFRVEITRWSELNQALLEPLEALARLVLSGGKRLRPGFCHWGFVAGGGDPSDQRIIDAGAAFEMLQGFALIHDDIMDGSATRRGQTSVHRLFLQHHSERDWVGESRRFGEGAAILVGDLALVYAETLMPQTSPEALKLWHELQIELNIGQYLDLYATASVRFDRELTRKIARYKSGKYTIQRPLQVGALLAGSPRGAKDLEVFGDNLGEAFQLRDDLLGVFGASSQTGKPVGDDLREGKPTLLMAIAMERANPTQRALFDTVGSPKFDTSHIEAIQAELVQCGAVDETEAEITRLADFAISTLDEIGLTDDVHQALVDLAAYVVARKG